MAGENEFSILIVDDNPDNLRVLQDTLEERGFGVRVSTNGEMALQSAQAMPPDLILLDIHMPIMDGYEACRRMKEMPALKDTPIIFLSALTETFNKLKAFEVGGVAYITKPFEPMEVLAYLDSHLRLSQSSKQLQEMNEELKGLKDKLEGMVKERTMQLKESKEQFYDMVMSLDEGFFSATLDGMLLNHNPAFNRLLGYGDDENLIGTTLLDFWQDPKDRKDYVETLLRDGFIKNYIFNAKKKEGEWAVAQVQAHIVKNENGDPVRIDGTVLDITEQKNAEEQIKASLAEKETLLSEIHHRVKNNLQIVVSLMDLSSKECLDENSKAIFLDMQNRVGSMALVHEALYQSDNLAEISFKGYVDNLAQTLVSAFSQKEKAPHLELDLEEVMLGIDDSIPLGLLLNEVITNSLEHAFPGEEKGTISIKMHKAEEDLSIVIADDGVGIDPDINIQETKTLGIRLIQMLGKQIGAETKIERDGGTKISIILPLIKRYAERI